MRDAPPSTMARSPARSCATLAAAVDDEEEVRIWEEELEKFLRGILDEGIEVGFILDGPTLAVNPAKCLEVEDSILPCTPDLDSAMAATREIRAAEIRVVDRLGGLSVFDVAEAICTRTTCQLEIDGRLVFVDAHHLSEEFTMTQQTALKRLLDTLTKA